MPFTGVDGPTSDKQDPAQYTGDVWNEIIARGESPSRLLVGRATFTPASRTAWHTHPHGQILVGVSGIGRVQTAGEAVRELRPGDTVSVGPDQPHWHGAAPDRVFVHIAMQETDEHGESAQWHEHVTDTEYNDVGAQDGGVSDARVVEPSAEEPATTSPGDALTAAGDREFPAQALVRTQQDSAQDATEFTNEDIRSLELERARHALTYLKQRIGNAEMRELLADDLARTKEQVTTWLHASKERWQSASIELTVAGLHAQQFADWYAGALRAGREPAFRAGHPEHFVSHPRDDGIEVIENIGETELPWHVFYRSLPEDGDFPVAWDRDFPVRFGAEILDDDGSRIGFSMRQARDTDDGMHLRITAFLPQEVPPGLMHNHLHHLAIEYRNWARMSANPAEA